MHPTSHPLHHRTPEAQPCVVSRVTQQLRFTGRNLVQHVYGHTMFRFAHSRFQELEDAHVAVRPAVADEVDGAVRLAKAALLPELPLYTKSRTQHFLLLLLQLQLFLVLLLIVHGNSRIIANGNSTR